MVVIQKMGLGSVPPGEHAFSNGMLDRFLHTLEIQALRPDAICLYTDGVRVACKGSPLLLSLQLLQGAGVRVLVCRTCLEHFNLVDQLAAGEVSSMKEIVECMSRATRVLYP